MRCKAWLLSVAVALAAALSAQATDTETREFSIYVDGKPAGLSRLTLVQQDDGSVYVSGNVEAKVQGILRLHTYQAEAQEWWKNGKLFALKLTANDNGKKADIQCNADGDQLRMRVNGEERRVRGDVWPTSYWKLDPRHNKQVPLLEVDTGREFTGELKYLATEPIKVGDQLVQCYHFRVTGGPSTIDLWYDQYHRLVRQEFLESGLRTLVFLTSVRR